MISHQIETIYTEIKIILKEPNRNCGVAKYNWDEKFIRVAQ